MDSKITYLKDIAQKYESEGKYVEADKVIDLLRKIAQSTPVAPPAQPVAPPAQPVAPPAQPAAPPAQPAASPSMGTQPSNQTTATITPLMGTLNSILQYSHSLMQLNPQKYSGLYNLNQYVSRYINTLQHPDQNSGTSITQNLEGGSITFNNAASGKFVRLSQQAPNYYQETNAEQPLKSLMQAALREFASLPLAIQQNLSTLPNILSRPLTDFASMYPEIMIDHVTGKPIITNTESGFNTRTEDQGYTITKTPDGYKNTKQENNINKLINQWVQTGKDDPQGRGQNYAYELMDRYIKVYLLPWIKQQPYGTVTLQVAQKQLSQILVQHQQSQKFIGMANQWLGQYFPGQQAGATGQTNNNNNGQQNQNSELNNLYIFRRGNPKHNGIPVSKLFGTNGQPDPYSGEGFLLPLAQFGNTTSPTDPLYDARGVKQPFNWNGSQIIQSRQYDNGDLASPIPTQTGI